MDIFFASVGGWDEKFLQQESELKRVRSEKANLEQHILGMESELETLQEERTKLKNEMETQRRTYSGMEQQTETLMTEVSTMAKACELKYHHSTALLIMSLTDLSVWCNYCKSLFFQAAQLRSELVSCTEERDDLNQSLSQWREKVHSLEKTNCDTRNIISILEDDIRAGRKEYEALKNSTDKLKTEKQQVCTLVHNYLYGLLF